MTPNGQFGPESLRHFSGQGGYLTNELYAARLVKEGLARHGTWRCLNLVGDLLSWTTRSRSKPTDLDERMVERYLRQRAGKRIIQSGGRAALTRLLSVLRNAGMIAPAALRPIRWLHARQSEPCSVYNY